MFTWAAGPRVQESFHEQCRADRVRGTCDWFFDTNEFRHWSQRSFPVDDESILWCVGEPGIGKTMLASRIIDELRDGHIVAYVYMGSGTLYSASGVITSLLNQLCLPFHIVPDRLRQIYEVSSGEPNQKLDLKDLLVALKEASQMVEQPIIFVIDGLDRTNIREEKEFIEVFSSLKDTSGKWLVTSRPDQDIASKACDGCSRYVIGEDSVIKDIRNLVESIIQDNGAIADLLSNEPNSRLEVIDSVSSRAHGRFHWVTLQMRHLLDQTCLSGILRALQYIPHDIAGIVESAFKMIKVQEAARTQIAVQTIALLTTSRTPVTAEAMCHAVGISHVLASNKDPSELGKDEIPNPTSIVECCMGLITIDPESTIARLTHHDIAQHVREQWSTLFGKKERLELWKICMTYLSLAAFSSGPCNEGDTFSRRLETYPFLDYASRHWGYHAREALLLLESDVEGNEEIVSDINSLLHKRSNLESALQVDEVKSEVQAALLEDSKQYFAMDANKFRSVTSLQLATRHGFTTIVQDAISKDPQLISKHDSYGTTALHEAARAGWINIVEILLKAGAQPSVTDNKQKSPLFYAAENGHFKVTLILQEQSDSSYPQQARSPVLQAARNGHNQIVSILKGNSKDLELEEALCSAAEAGKLDVVKQLLEHGVSPDSKKNGVSAMVIAVQAGHEAALRLLLRHNANPTCEPLSQSDHIPLHQAIRNNRIDLAAILIDNYANVQTIDNLERTALFETLNKPDLEGVVLLLTHGTNVSHRDYLGGTVLHEAASTGAVEHASFFMGQGIQVDVSNKEGLTPLHLAASHGHHEIVYCLIHEGAAINRCDPVGKTPLIYATLSGDTELCQILLCHGASVNPKTSYQKTPLTLAAAAGHLEMVKLFIEFGADPNTPGTDLKSPLWLAAEAGHQSVLRWLLNHGADVDAPADGTHTALLLAASFGLEPIVRILLQNGADVNATRADMKTVLMLAAEAGHSEIAELLMEHGALLNAEGEEQKAAARRAAEAEAVKVMEMLNAMNARGRAGQERI